MIGLFQTDYARNGIIFSIGYATFIIGLFLILLFTKKKKNKIEIFDIIVVLIIIFIASIRYKVGADYESYYNFYRNILYKYSTFYEGIINSANPFMYMLAYITKMLLSKNYYGNQYGIFWTTSIIIYGITLFTIIKRSEKPAYSFLLFGMLGFLGNTTNILKQWLAMSIILYSLKYLQNNKYIHFILLSAISIGFHPTAIIMIILSLIAKKGIKPNKNYYKFMIILGIILVIVFSIIPIILKYIPFVNSDKFFSYFSGELRGYNSTVYAKIGMIVYLISYLLLIYMVICNSKSIIEKNNDNKLYINMILLSIPFIILAAFKQRYIIRVAIFLDLPIIFVLPLVPDCIKSIKAKKSIIIILSAIIAIFFVGFTVFYRDMYFSYQTYLNI